MTLLRYTLSFPGLVLLGLSIALPLHAIWDRSSASTRSHARSYEECRFLTACREGNLPTVEDFLNTENFHSYHSHRCTKDGCMITGLHLASRLGHDQIAKALIEAEASVNHTVNGESPLYAACTQGHIEVVRLLLRARANPNQAANDGITPLSVASAYGYGHVVNSLLGAGADCNQAANNGDTPLLYASTHGHENIVNMLLGANADPNQAANDGTTPLFMASQGGHDGIVRLLIAAGADPDIGWRYYSCLPPRKPLTQAKRERLLTLPGSKKRAAYNNIISALSQAHNSGRLVRYHHGDGLPAAVPLLHSFSRQCAKIR